MSFLRRTRLVIIVVAAVGIAVSAYLTWVHYSGSLALCVGVGGCEAVQASRYAQIGPLPVAALGLAGFVAIAAVTAFRLRPDPPAWTLTALFTLALAGTLYAAYLTYLELFVIGTVCPWCLTVALSSAAVLILTTRELRAVADLASLFGRPRAAVHSVRAIKAGTRRVRGPAGGAARVRLCDRRRAHHCVPRWVRRGRVVAGETVSIFGCGGLGLSAVQVATERRAERKLPVGRVLPRSPPPRARPDLRAHR